MTSSYLDEVLADSPAGLWLLNESAGVAAVDYVDTRDFRNGAYVGGPTLAGSPLVGAGPAVTTTSSSYVRIPTPVDKLGLQWTMELWFRYGSGGKIFSDAANFWSLDLSGTNPVLMIGGGSQTVTGVTSASLKTGRHHLVLQGEAGTAAIVRLYLDGTLADSWPYKRPPAADFFLGKDAATTYSPGTFSAIAFYNSTLSSTRIAAHHAAADSYLLPPVDITVAPAPMLLAQDSQTLPPLSITVAPQPISQPPAARSTVTSATGGLRLASFGSATWDPPVDSGPTVTAPSYSAISAVVVDDTTTTGPRSVPTVRTVSRPRTGYRILVGGKDVTFFRGVRTPFPSYALISPLLYGSGSLTFPQIHGALERPGHGDLSWLTKFAKVRVQRLDDGGHVVAGGARDFVGFVADFPPSGRDLTVTLGGEASGLAAMQDRPTVIFPRVTDIGAQVQQTIRHSLRLPTSNVPTTGVETAETGGTGSHLDWLTDVLAKSTEVDGTQWTVGVDSAGAYRMHRKDLETIDATVYIDGFRNAENLKRDFSEEPNRIWASGIDPDGKRVRFAIFPGLAPEGHPPFPGALNPGDEGDDVTALIWRLFTVGYLDATPFNMLWTDDAGDDVTAAVKTLQDDAGLAQTGVVNSATWDALFDPAVTGYTLRRSSIKPAAQRGYTQAFLRDASGQITRPNPNYDRSRPMVDVTLDMGAGFTRGQIKRWSAHELADDSTSNWVGTITVSTGAVIDGEHNPGDPLDASGLRDVRSLKPGMNLWLPNWDGGTLVHLSGVNHSPGSCELTVDTRARDTMKVWEVIRRNRESRRNPSRQWIAQNRRSGISDDTGSFYDGSVFGKVPRVFLPGKRWSVIPTPAGRSGQIGKVDISLVDDPALFVVAAFGRRVTASRLASLIGDPLSKAGSANWRHKNKTLTDTFWLAWTMGGVDDAGNDQPCGYWPEHVTVDADGTVHHPDVTGDFRDDAGVPYFCKGAPVLWLAVYPDRDTHLQGGRVLELQLDDASY